VKNTFVDEMQD